MSPEIQAWLKAGHLIGVVLWISGLASVYWLLRIHSHAPKDAHEKLTLMERSIAMSMDLAATLAMGCGLASAIIFKKFSAPGAGYLHIKLLVVALGILSVHGLVRARIKRYGMGQIKPMPGWAWTLLLSSIAAIMILVTVVKQAMLPEVPAIEQTMPK
ncbi:MAG: CopD family protein [Kofleriaceae bacterium]